jgi:CO/xanthine dehydrogenase FAD-binding subunit
MPLAYQNVSELGAVAALLAAHGGARLLGGGTLLVRRVNEGDTSIDTYVRLRDPELLLLDAGGEAVRLGAGITMSRIAREPALAFLAPVAKVIGGPAVRAAATVGGNLFAPSPYGDFGVALLALDATISVEDTGGASEFSAETFFGARDDLAAGSIVTAVTFRRPAEGAFRYLKVSRVRPKGAAVLSIAVMLNRTNGIVTEARIAFGAMAKTPIRSHGAENALTGMVLTAESIERAAMAAAEDTSPATDAIASGWYRKAVLPVHLRRLLLEVSSS